MQDLQKLIAGAELNAALQNVQEKIRQNPAEPKLRVFLFQLHCVLGNWQKALTQLHVLKELDAKNILMAQTYEPVLWCEALRAQIMAGQKLPLIFGEPQNWMALLLEAIKQEAAGLFEQAEKLRQDALDQAQPSSGEIDGVAFDWIADADYRFGPVIEAIINGRYFWAPFTQIKRIELEKPVDLRDMVWMPAHFTWVNEGLASGFIPCRYPGSELSTDCRIQLCRMTEWKETLGRQAIGLGQRLFATNIEDYSILDTRIIQLNQVEAA